MPITLDTVKSKGKLVADNERYRVHDYDLGDLTVSMTELKKGQATRGHAHDLNAEVYIFPEGGDAEMEVGPERFDVHQRAILVRRGEFHRVVNRSRTSDLIFVSIFSGRRDATGAKYAPAQTNRSRVQTEPASQITPAP
ncbi:MAG: cupin [Thaumarchaeota archaeon]|nr:cupin [Nitrososphaerota archaeon]